MLNIGIIGGTGSLGKGLALRWSKNNNVLLGSRDLSKAKRLASEYLQISKSFYGNNMLGNITGTDNNDLVSLEFLWGIIDASNTPEIVEWIPDL